MESELSKMKSQTRHLEGDLSRKIDEMAKCEAELRLSQQENVAKSDDIEKLEHNIKDLKVCKLV